MKICVLLPSEQQKEQAGVRIRYMRIAPILSELGHQLEMLPIQEFTANIASQYNVFLVSKCYDARAIIAAQVLRNQGKPVGVDLFDDYFSQANDSRFVRLRYWLRSMLEHCSFVLCSTLRMRELARAYTKNLPIHVMNDPAEPFDMVAMAAALSNKLKLIKETDNLNVAWFGMGDNPNFPVGLSDLISFGGELARLRGHEFNVRLEILTNRRAMTPDNLASLRRLPVPYTLEEWSETRERELLGRSLLCFLPVNAQSFSTVKSLNRAVTALTAGVQVLSAGYPLYQPFADYIYRDATLFMADLVSENLKLRVDTLPYLVQTLNKVANVEHESMMLASFLGRQLDEVVKPSRAAGAAVIHGKESSGDVHKFAQRLGGISIASPFCAGELNYDVRFVFPANGDGLDVLISEKKAGMLASGYRRHLVDGGKILSTTYKKIQIAKVFPDLEIFGHALLQMDTPCATTAAYAPLLQGMIEVVSRLFPDLTCCVSEQTKQFPWHAPASKRSVVKELQT